MEDIFANHFKVIKIDHPKYDYLVVSSTPCDATKYIKSEDFQKVKNGTIAFDLLLHCGLRDRRFATMEIHNGILDKGSLKHYSHLDNALEQESIKFFAMHTNLITQFLLTDKERNTMFHQIRDYFCVNYV